MRKYNYFIKVIPLICFLLVTSLTGQEKESALNGTFSLGYSHIYNYEVNDSEKINADLVRVNLILTLGRFLLESDYQYIFVGSQNTTFFHNSFGYAMYSGKYLPKTYALVSYIHAKEFPLNDLIYNKTHQGFGFGGMFRINLDVLLKGDANFTVTYFPSDRIFYKSMQVGWDFKFVGISVGGIGIRVPEGRLYSGFIFQLRYKW
jgi:hypothetical protein